MSYDPTIQGLLGKAKERWGTPAENKKLLVPYGIGPLDQALYGLDVVNGEMIIVQGEEKRRKTTFIENVVINYMLNPVELRPYTVVDMLESGMKPDKYLDTLIANVASRWLIDQGHMPTMRFPCKKCGGDGPCKELVLSHKFLKFNTRSEQQNMAIEWAMEQMSDWPMDVYGPSVEEGDTRNLESSVLGTKDQDSRWVRLIKTKGAKVFVTDHLQQYDLKLADYEKMLEVIPAHSDVVAKYNVVDFVISQVSMSSAKDAAAGMGKMTASGGRKAAQESNTIFSTSYESGSSKMAITVEDSRDAGSFSVWQPLEETSGAFYGNSSRVEKMEYRPGAQASQPQSNGRSKGR